MSLPIDPRLVVSMVCGFLLGSLPFSVWIGRRAGGVDVRSHGSRNPGAANVWRTVGRASGVLVGAADAAKGAGAVLVAWMLGQPDGVAAWAGVAAVLGHDFSPLLRFKGGKGGATTCGALACFIFPELLVVLAIWIVLGSVDRSRRFVWSIAALSTAPLLALSSGRSGVWLPGQAAPRPAGVILASTFLVVLLWVRILPGLRRSHA